MASTGPPAGAHVEVGEDLCPALPQRPAQLRELREFLGYTRSDGLEELVHRDLALSAPRVFVGLD